MFIAIGPLQVILLTLVLPGAFFVLGFYFGKRAGYLKGVKETENQSK